MFIACLLSSCALAQTPTTREATVKAPTRLDWAFAASGFGKDAGAVPASFDSSKLRYLSYVPKTYDKKKAWPLVVFISPSDQPTGWTAWQKVCTQEQVFFASPYGAGNNVPAAQRTRIILDVLDDVRRAYRIDPEQTYLAGFSGGGRMACAIAFALPEYFGGVVPICGTNPLGGTTYLRHLVEDRLSVAFVTGEKDFNRKENEVYMAPWFEELKIRTKLWIVPKLGHGIPDSSVLVQVYTWLKEDVARRREVAGRRPKLAVAPEEAPTAADQAQRLLAAAQAELKDPRTVWRAVALLQGASQRGGKTAAGREASALLQKIARDEQLLAVIAEQGAADEQRSLSAQARALERNGQIREALEAWLFLAKNYADTEFGRTATTEVRRLQRK